MRSNAPASPSWARRMASASLISLESGCLVRVTVPDGTHPLNGMHPWLLKLHLCECPVLVRYRSRLPRAGPAARPCGELDNCSQQFILETLRPSRPNRKNGWDLHYEPAPKCLQFLGGQGAEERFQHDRCLPHAGIQVVSEHFEFPPGTSRVHQRPVGNILHDSASFFLQLFNNLFKCVQFVKETRPASENYSCKQIVHE